MKFAVWRLGAGFQTDDVSEVGGGKIARRIVEQLVEFGHEVRVLGPAKPTAVEWCRGAGVEYLPQPSTQQLRECDAVMLLTGPFNCMFGALYETYRRLAAFEGRVFYAWWDTALPFHFEPERVKMFREKCDVDSLSLLRDKQWTLLTQLRALPSMPKSVGAAVLEVERRQCFWELTEVEGEPLPIADDPHPQLAYFGSDRPGRVSEIARWFGKLDAPPLHLYGRWSEKSLAKLKYGNVSYRGPVLESQVRALLNRYTATLHSADAAYVKSDFVAQRFVENAMASVPVAYSDRVQPSVAAVIPRGVMRSADDFELWWSLVQSKERRRGMTEGHTAAVRAWALAHPAFPRTVLEQL